MAHDETIRIYRSNEPGAEPPSLTYGELAANLADRKVFVGGPGGTADMIVIREIPNTGVTGISAGHTGIAVSGTTGFVRVFNMGVHTFNGATGHITFNPATGNTVLAGSGIAIPNSLDNTRTIINVGVTGIGFGNDVGLTGKINLTSGTSITFDLLANNTIKINSTGVVGSTGDTVAAGVGMSVVRTGGTNVVTINNLGVTSFNGLTGAVALTGDGGAIVGASNNTIRARLAGASLTGVASFPTTDFGVMNGEVSLTGNVARTNAGQTFTAFQNFTAGLSGNLTGSATSLGGTGANLWALQSWVNTNFADVQSVSQDIQNLQINKANRTGNNASGTWPISITGNAATATTATQVSNALTFGSGLAGSTSTYNGSSAVTLTNIGVTGISAGHTGIALSGTTGNVQIWNIGVLSINGQTGHYTLPAAGATGDTVTAGLAIGVSVVSGNQKRIDNLGVTSFNGLTGAVTLTGDGGAVVGINNNAIRARLATESLTGVASFPAAFFAVNNGAVSLSGPYSIIGVTGISAGHTGISLIGTTGNVHIFNMGVLSLDGQTGHLTRGSTGDTITAGLAIGVSVVSGNQKRIDNLGVTSFNGLTGAVTLTGDGGAIIGVANNVIRARLATESLTGVASFPTTDFGVVNGQVSLTGNVARTNQSNVFLSTQFFPGRFTAIGATFTSLGVNITSGGNLNVASPGKVIAPNITPMAGFDWSLVTADRDVSPNKGILANKSPSNGKLVLTLNTDNTELAVGSVVRVSGVTGSWEIRAPGGSQIHFGNVSLTPTNGIPEYGYLSSTHHRDSVELVCYGVQSLGGLGGIGAFWNVISSVGSIETGIGSEPLGL